MKAMILITLALCSIPPSIAASETPATRENTVIGCQKPTSGRPDDWASRLEQRIYADWSPFLTPVTDEALLQGSIGNDGRLYDVEVLQSSGNLQFDADCLQAVLGAAGFAPRENAVPGVLTHTSWVFNPSTRCGHLASAITQHAVHAGLGQYVSIYRIPLDVLKRYPGLFSEKELLSDSNVIQIRAICPGLKKGDCIDLTHSPVGDIASIYGGPWFDFFSKHPSLHNSRNKP
jgi:TonB family protein